VAPNLYATSFRVAPLAHLSRRYTLRLLLLLTRDFPAPRLAQPKSLAVFHESFYLETETGHSRALHH